MLEWQGQMTDLNLIKNLWQDFKIDIHQRSPSNLIEVEHIMLCGQRSQ